MPRSRTAAPAAGRASAADRPISAIIGDIFETIFGSAFGGGARQTPRRGADMRYDMQVSLEEAFHGKDTEVEVEVSVACEPCGGSGAEAGTGRRTCNLCSGRGKVRAQQGLFVIERPCPTCHGSGQVIENPCRKCRGEGRVDAMQRSSKSQIPPGVDNGTRIRLSGKGRGRAAGCSAGRPLHLHPPQAARDVRTGRDRSVHPHADRASPTPRSAERSIFRASTAKSTRSRFPPASSRASSFASAAAGMPVLQGRGRGDLVVEIDGRNPDQSSPPARRKFYASSRTPRPARNVPKAQASSTGLKHAWNDLT